MLFDSDQLIVSLLAVFVAMMASAAIVFQRRYRPVAYTVVCGCAVAALVTWTDFGKFHTIYVVTSHPAAGTNGAQPAREERHQPFHLHEFFHYYMGSKYFAELGYLGLYDCTALADKEVADEDHEGARIGGYIRDLDDVLKDKTYEQALDDCRTQHPFSPARWASFKNDLRELHRLVPDGWWGSVVFDAGFNPPPSWVVVDSAIANVIPIRVGRAPTYLLATGIDMGLLLIAFFALRSAFGRTAAAVAVVFFGATFIASYGWNGGAFLRFTWLTSLCLSLAAMKKGRWALAGALLGASVADRIFPAGFAAGAMIPMAALAWRSPEHRARLVRFVGAMAASFAALALLAAIVFGPHRWVVFAERIGRHGDVYYVMHIGLKKVMGFREWVLNQNFHGHDGLARFRSWNLRLRAQWHDMRPWTWLVQLLAVVGAIGASLRRKPYEAALVGGVVFMFAFNLPANYYYVVLALVPAMLVRAAASAPTELRRLREYGAFVAFGAFWLTTLVSSRVWDSDIRYDYWICVGLAAFLVAWFAAWTRPKRAEAIAASIGRWIRARYWSGRTSPAPTGGPPEDRPSTS